MYCENCCRIIEAGPCPVCKNTHVREPGPKDPCFLTELDYVSSGILEDVLTQNSIPCLKKNVMGAGLAIRVGPMLDRSRFYVSFEQLKSAEEIMAELFSAPEGADCAGAETDCTGAEAPVQEQPE